MLYHRDQDDQTRPIFNKECFLIVWFAILQGLIAVPLKNHVSELTFLLPPGIKGLMGS